MTTQRGGTLLGLIFGLLIGLAIALGTAIYIGKVPVPFVNKGQTRHPDSDAAEEKRNQGWNPNAPLSGKSLDKPLAPSPTVGDGKPAVAADSDNQPPPSPKASADPLGDLVKSKANAAPAEPFTYFVQAGAFNAAADAEAQRAKLSLLGVQAKVSERDVAGHTVYRVRVGPFDQKEEADKAKERLDKNAIETALVRIQR
jgi:cell division protein FtsN